MNKFLKKAVSFVLAVAIFSSIGCVAFANAEMENMVFVGYDTTVPTSPNKIFNEVIDGVQTGKQILVPVTPVFKAEGYEGVYPYAGYNRMYLEGNAQPITAYNGLFPQWEERRQDYMWELKAPYFVYERQQTKVNNEADGWTWDFGNDAFGIPDSALLTKTNRAAVVLDQGYKYYGFGPYDADANVLTLEEEYMYKNFLVPTGTPGVSTTVYDAAVEQWKTITGKTKGYYPDNRAWDNDALLSVNSLSARGGEFDKYLVTDEMIAAAIPVVYTKYVTAKFNANDNKGLATKNVADEYLATYNDGWEWDVDDSFAVVGNANIDWTDPTFEHDTHRMFQYLIINHHVMDGTNGKERIVRYTDGKALPDEEWRFVFYQHKLDENGKEIPHLYDAVEQKYINGVAVLDNFGNYIYRIPTLGEFENRYFVKNGNAIEVWKVDAEGKESRLEKVDNWVGSLGGFIDAYANGSYKLINSVPAERDKMLP